MSAFLLNALGFFIVSFVVVSLIEGVMFRDDLKNALKEYKDEREMKKQRQKLI